MATLTTASSAPVMFAIDRTSNYLIGNGTMAEVRDAVWKYIHADRTGTTKVEILSAQQMANLVDFLPRKQQADAACTRTRTRLVAASQTDYAKLRRDMDTLKSSWYAKNCDLYRYCIKAFEQDLLVSPRQAAVVAGWASRVRSLAQTK